MRVVGANMMVSTEIYIRKCQKNSMFACDNKIACLRGVNRMAYMRGANE